MAPEDAVCAALKDVVAQVRPGETTKSAYRSIDIPGAIFSVECEHNGDPRWMRYCPIVLNHTSHEFFNAYAYQIHDCVAANGRVLDLRTDGEESGLARRSNMVSMDGVIGRIHVRVTEVERGYELTLSR
ncbi:MAG TPA: hypothetical protein VG943_00235 [Caulobacterales bacterium]|nr:hypothetical protein [Caulobacterales bacterium]